MRAITQPGFGGPEILALTELPDPEVGEDEVLVRVHAVSLNFGDRMMLQGLPLLFRPLVYGWSRPSKSIVGHDMAGIVEAVGSKVTSVAPGDSVFGESGRGSCAELIVVPESQATKMPEGLTFDDAATLPVAGITALQGLRDRAAVKPGDEVLIVGASGSVGTMATQIAKALGARVTAVCSTGKVEQARSIGADEVIDYTQQDYTTVGPRFDVIFDLVGTHRLAERRRALKPDGIYVATFGQGGSAWLGPLARILWVAIMSFFSKQRLVVHTVTENVEADLLELARLVDTGALKPAIAETFPLERTADAFEMLVGGHAPAKLVIRVAE